MRTSATSALGCLLLTLLAGACRTDGVLPPGLESRGSLGSVEYTAAELYPSAGSPMELVHPRAGSPCLLGPHEDAFRARIWLADSGEATALAIAARAVDGTTYPLTVTAPVECDSLGLCDLVLDLPPEVPDDTLLGLCVEGPSGSRCRPGALRRYSAIPNPLRVAHVTDTHLEDGTAGEPLAKRLEHLLAHLGDFRPALHAIAITGDLTNRGRTDSTLRVAEILGASPLPVIAVPGNHDFKDGGITRYLLAVTPELDHAHRLGPYLLVALNSGPGRWEQERRGWNGESSGMEARQIAWLAEQLATLAGPEGAALVLLHNPPFSALGMTIGRRRRDLLRVAREGRVSAILAGHTHRQEVFDRAGVGQGLSVRREGNVPPTRFPITLVFSPSLDRLEGGVRVVELSPDGGLTYDTIAVDWP